MNGLIDQGFAVALACVIAACLLIGGLPGASKRQCVLWSETPSRALAHGQAGEP